MDKLKMQSENLVDRNIDKIAAAFPNCVTEGKNEQGEIVRVVDFDLLKQELSRDIVEGMDERYTLNWAGKKQSILTANSPIAKTLRPCKEESVNFDSTQNLYIEGDNLDVLKLLRETYLNKVKMIYIDPPYNTGNDFVYEDDFASSADEYLENSKSFDEQGNRLFQNNDSNGRFHSDWLSMMFSRLRLAKDLLTDDGVIFISIDDNEQSNLKKICDEVFGASNFVNQIVLKTKASSGASGGGEDKRLKKNVEYVLWYAKSYSLVKYDQPIEKIKLIDYINEHKKANTGFYYTRVITNYGERKLVGTTQDGSGEEIKIYKHNNFVFRSVNELIKEEAISLEQGYNKYYKNIFMVTNAQTSILTRVNRFVDKKNELISYEYIPRSGKSKGKVETKLIWNETLVVWLRDTVLCENNTLYKTESKGTLWEDVSWGRLDLEGDVAFKNGKKPIALLKTFANFICSKDDIILDFFSGSATTAHAVMQLNAEDGGERKFIMVQLPEVTEIKSEAYKAGYKNICEIGKERIRRAGNKIKTENQMTAPNLDTGFRVLKLDTTCMKDVYYFPSDIDQKSLTKLESNIKEDRTPEDLLFQVMLDMGVLLSSTIEVINYKCKLINGGQEILNNPSLINNHLSLITNGGEKVIKVFNVNDNNLICCFDSNLTEEVVTQIAKLKPLYAVFRDSSMNSDSTAVNFDQIFATYSPTTTRRVI